MILKRCFPIASVLLVLVLLLSPIRAPVQATDGGSTYEDYPVGSTFRTETISAGTAHVCTVQSNGTLSCWGLDDAGQASPNTYTGIYTQIASGYQHTCGIRENGTVDCWGDNAEGQLDLYPNEQAIFQQISAGQNFTCGILVNGALFCWGNDDYGQVSNAPSGVFTQVNAGYRHACGIKLDGYVECWGDDTSSQVSDAPSGIFYQVSAGNNHTCGILSDSTIECWGSDEDGQSTPPPLVDMYTQVSAGSTHTCAIKANGELECWGDDTYGQIGDAPIGYFTQITAGSDFNCGIHSDGTASCWGYSDDGQTALPSDLTSLGTAQLFVGSTASCLITTSGRLKCWGSNWNSNMVSETPTNGVFTQVGGSFENACGIKQDGSLICWGALNITSTGPYTQVSASDNHACAVSPWGNVTCWGNNANGQGTPPAGVLFKQVSAGLGFTCGIKTNNQLQCWGLAGEYTNPPAGTYKQVSSGLHHSCAIDTNGAVQCWGSSGYGGTVEPAGTFKQISSSNLHNCAIRTDNTVYCWGLDGLYPDNPELIANNPPAGVRFRQISDEGFNACGITTYGNLSCWGQNNYGQAPYARVSPATLPRATQGVAYSQQISFSGGAAPYTASLYSGTLPPGLSLSTAGLLSGTPAAGSGGNTYNFTMRVRYPFDITVDTFKSYTMVINRAPSASDQTVTMDEDTTRTINLVASDPDGDTLHWTYNSPSHASSVTYNSASVIYTPLANWNGTDTFTFHVNDGLVNSRTATVTINVRPVNDPPVPSAQADVTWQIGKPGSLVIAPFTDVDTATLTYSARQQGGAALPSWLSFNATARTFSGTPASSNAGSYTLEVLANDGQYTRSLTFTLSVVDRVYLPLISR